MAPLIELSIPIYHAGFRPNRSCYDHVPSLTSHKEKGYNNKLKSGVAFIDLTTPYNIVRKDGLLRKLSRLYYAHIWYGILELVLETRIFKCFEN